jgi:ABC-type sugar transport system ATPase subunit
MQVELIEPLGSEAVVHGRLAGTGEVLVARVAGTAPPGEAIEFALPPQDLHLFERASCLWIEPELRSD